MDDDELYNAFPFRHHKLLIICDELADDFISLCDAPHKGSLHDCFRSCIIFHKIS